jgi:hypothetical protein
MAYVQSRVSVQVDADHHNINIALILNSRSMRSIGTAGLKVPQYIGRRRFRFVFSNDWACGMV